MQHIKEILENDRTMLHRYVGTVPTLQTLEDVGNADLGTPRAVVVAPCVDGQIVVVDVIDYERPIDFMPVGPTQVIR